MNPPADPDLENRLRALTWRPVPEPALQASLDAALAELSSDATTSSKARPGLVPPAPVPLSPSSQTTVPIRQRLIQFVPRPVRWILAACWMLSLGFRLATPPSAPVQGSLSPAAIAALPPMDGSRLFLSMQQTRLQIDDLQRELQRR
jgi:hypothetical protein